MEIGDEFWHILPVSCRYFYWHLWKYFGDYQDLNDNHRQAYKIVFRIKNFVPHENFLERLKSSISVGDNQSHTNTNTDFEKKNNCKMCLCIGVTLILTNTNITFQALYEA